MDIFNSVVDVTHIPCVLVCIIWIPILWTKKFHFYIHNLSYVVLFQEIFNRSFARVHCFQYKRLWLWLEQIFFLSKNIKGLFKNKFFKWFNTTHLKIQIWLQNLQTFKKLNILWHWTSQTLWMLFTEFLYVILFNF